MTMRSKMFREIEIIGLAHRSDRSGIPVQERFRFRFGERYDSYEFSNQNLPKTLLNFEPLQVPTVP